MQENSKELIEKRKQKIKSLFKDNYQFISIILGVFILIVYLYYFFKLGNQPIWWDEGDYLAIAKVWALNMEKPEWWQHFTGMRPLFLPFLWSFIFKIGIGETGLRFFSELLPALFSIFLIFLLGKEMFNKKVGLIAMSFVAFNWVFMFYSFRLLTDAPTTFFGILCLTLFWVGYEKNNKNYFLYLSVISGILSFLMRYTSALILISIAIYLILTRGFLLIKKKEIWVAFFIGILCLFPFFAYNYSTQGSIFPALDFYHGSESTAVERPLGWHTVFFHLPLFMSKIPLFFFIIGFIFSLEFIFYLDLIFYKKFSDKKNLLFLFITTVIFPIYLVFGIRVADARYYMSFSAPLFITAGLGMVILYEKIIKFLNLNKKYVLILIIFSLLFILPIQLKSASSFINGKYGSYGELQDAGLWLKENTLEDSKIITASIVQIQYYSERQTYDFYTNDSIWGECVTDLDGRLSGNETCQKGTEKAFNNKINRINPDYFIIHGYEPVFTPNWAYTYPQRYNLTPIVSFGNYNGNPTLIIYKFNN